MDKEVIKKVLLENQRLVQNVNLVKRDFTFEDFGNYVLVGIRRAGKSYLLFQRMQQLLAKGIGWDRMVYINFEDERLSTMTTDDLNSILEVHYEMYAAKPILFLDEIQNIPHWDKFVRRMADNKYQVYVTGSNAKMLSTDVQTVLGGRYISVNVYPYNFKEFLKANGIDFHPNDLYVTETKAEIMRLFNSYFHFGGFPEGASLPEKRGYLTSVYQKIYLGDIAMRHTVSNTFALRLIFRKMAEGVKQPLSFNRIASIVSSAGAKVSTNTIINYVDYAKDAWLICPITNIAAKISEKESKQKYYFTDNGILNLFLLDGETSLLENLVAITLLRKYGRSDMVFFYNKEIEVDFYLPDTATAIQVSYSINASADTFNREVDALRKLQKVLDCKRFFIITYDEERVIELDGMSINVIPVWKWMLE